MCKRVLITVILILASIPAFAQVETAAINRYSGAQSGGDTAPGDCCNHDGIRGDCCYDMSLNIADLECYVSYLFGFPLAECCFLCFEECDVDGSGVINIADLAYLVDYLFCNGPPLQPC